MENEAAGAAFGWPGLIGALLVLLGAALLFLGARQRRMPIDVSRPPKTTWFAKYLAGIALIVAGASQLLPLLRG